MTRHRRHTRTLLFMAAAALMPNAATPLLLLRHATLMIRHAAMRPRRHFAAMLAAITPPRCLCVMLIFAATPTGAADTPRRAAATPLAADARAGCATATPPRC